MNREKTLALPAVRTNDDGLKSMTTAQLRSRAKGWLDQMRFASRSHHKWLRQEFLLPVIDEYKTRPEAHAYGAAYAFLRDLDLKPGTVRQWRKRMVSPRPSNGRKRQGNGREGKSNGGGWNSPERIAFEVLPEAIESTLEALATGRIKLPPGTPADGNASFEHRLASFLGSVDKEGGATPAFRLAFRLVESRSEVVA